MSLRKLLLSAVALGVVILVVVAFAVYLSKDEEENRFVTPEIEVDEEEYAVYSDLIDIYFPQRGWGGDFRILVVGVEACPISISDLISNPIRAKLEDSFVTDLRAKEALGPRKIENRFSFDFQVVIVGPEELDKIFGDWEDFYTKFPDSQGYLTLTRVGFNTDKTKALVQMSNRVDDSAVSYHDVVLHKENGHWIIVEENILMAD